MNEFIYDLKKYLILSGSYFIISSVIGALIPLIAFGTIPFTYIQSVTIIWIITILIFIFVKVLVKVGIIDQEDVW